jgi:hypothetical protein
MSNPNQANQATSTTTSATTTPTTSTTSATTSATSTTTTSTTTSSIHAANSVEYHSTFDKYSAYYNDSAEVRESGYWKILYEIEPISELKSTIKHLQEKCKKLECMLDDFNELNNYGNSVKLSQLSFNDEPPVVASVERLNNLYGSILRYSCKCYLPHDIQLYDGKTYVCKHIHDSIEEARKVADAEYQHFIKCQKKETHLRGKIAATKRMIEILNIHGKNG